LVRIDARNFELSWYQTHKQTHTQAGLITIHCAAKLRGWQIGIPPYSPKNYAL